MKNLIKFWMTPDPITINGDNTLSVAYNLMRLNDVRHLPVVDDNERLVGILTWGDVREGRSKSDRSVVSSTSWEDHFLAATRDVRDYMTPFPHHITPEDSIYQAAKMMIDHKISGLPVVEAKRVVGIVTETDLFRFIVDTWPQADKASLASHDVVT